MVPAGAQSNIANTQASHLVRFLSWAQNPYIKRTNMAMCLITETLNDINKRLVEDPHVATIEVPLPSDNVRRIFIETNFGMKDDPESEAKKEAEKNSEDESSDEETTKAEPLDQSEPDGMSVKSITQVSNGLNLVNLNVAMARSKLSGKEVDILEFRRLKKNLIERQCHGLVTFLEPGHTLDMVVGHTAAKARLKMDAKWIVGGQLDAAPMGYLILSLIHISEPTRPY